MIAFAGLLMAAVAACASTTGGATPAGPSTAPTASPGPTSAPPSTGTTASATGHPGASGPDATGVAASFVLASGAQREVCGITLRVRFVPPSASGNSTDQAFLVGTPPGQPDPDQPAPGAVAPARSGSTATVLGQRFTVLAVDLSAGRVTLTALC
jgi:hypothetical protein